jgi:hypothetical protein
VSGQRLLTASGQIPTGAHRTWLQSRPGSEGRREVRRRVGRVWPDPVGRSALTGYLVRDASFGHLTENAAWLSPPMWTGAAGVWVGLGNSRAGSPEPYWLDSASIYGRAGSSQRAPRRSQASRATRVRPSAAPVK